MPRTSINHLVDHGSAGEYQTHLEPNAFESFRLSSSNVDGAAAGDASCEGHKVYKRVLNRLDGELRA